MHFDAPKEFTTEHTKGTERLRALERQSARMRGAKRLKSEQKLDAGVRPPWRVSRWSAPSVLFVCSVVNP